MAILTRSGRILMAKAIADKSVYMAWGRGDPLWDTAPPLPQRADFPTFDAWNAAFQQWQRDTEPFRERAAATALTDEVGRRLATSVAFVLPDDAGEIRVPNGTFTLSPNGIPTNYFYARFEFGFSEAVGEDIRELGIFVDCVPNAACPPGQRYFLPAEISDPGYLLAIEHVEKFTRAQTEKDYKFVLTI